MARYVALTTFLNEQHSDDVRVSFDDIERVLGRKLPRSAAVQRAFWSNNAANNVMTRAWLSAGFRSEQVDLPGRTVVFRKTKEVKVKGFEEARVPYAAGQETAAATFPLFGWQKGTITFAPDLDLTEPADPELGDFLDEHYGSYEPPA